MSESPLELATAIYALAIRSKRDLLQTLFYATRNSAADSWSFHRQIERYLSLHGDVAVGPWHSVAAPRELVEGKRIAEATAQDSALALMLILDYSMQRFRTDAEGVVDSRTIGPAIGNGVKLNAAIWALANQARHIHEWEECDHDKLEAKGEVKVLRSLDHDPLNLNAAREVICGLKAASYIDFEEILLLATSSIPTGNF
jgi:hypothetical protein